MISCFYAILVSVGVEKEIKDNRQMEKEISPMLLKKSAFTS